jgi:hypothetical protein
MVRKIGGIECFVAVISHKRPENMDALVDTIGAFTVFVNKEEGNSYAHSFQASNNRPFDDSIYMVVRPCGVNICDARNKAIEVAGDLPCVQVSDDLKGIRRVFFKNGKRVVVQSCFEEAASPAISHKFGNTDPPLAKPPFPPAEFARRGFFGGHLTQWPSNPPGRCRGSLDESANFVRIISS